MYTGISVSDTCAYTGLRHRSYPDTLRTVLIQPDTGLPVGDVFAGSGNNPECKIDAGPYGFCCFWHLVLPEMLHGAAHQ